MSRIEPVNPARADGKSKELLDRVEESFGMVPNLVRVLAHAPAALQGYLGFREALDDGGLSERLREQIALTVGQSNGCEYCLAAHSAIGSLAGLSELEIADSRRATSPHRKTEAALRFARKVAEQRGRVANADLSAVRDAGYGDAEIVEIVAAVALNTFTNYFNHVAETERDFPEVAPMAETARR